LSGPRHRRLGEVIAVIGDTHLPRGTRSLPEDCVRRLRAAGLILHTGDHSSVESLEALRALGPPVQAVYGNADEPALRESLPKELVVDVPGARIGMTHVPGPRVGREERLRARFPGCDAVVYGHTHVPQAEQVDGVWILNPGSPTERRSSPDWTMLELRIAAGKIEPELVRLEG
jgi:putative phosphoesterase